MNAAYVLLHPADDVWVALTAIAAGAGLGEGIKAGNDVPAGHKIARTPVAKGRPVHRYDKINHQNRTKT